MWSSFHSLLPPPSSRRHDRRLSPTLTGCPLTAAALERVDPAHRSVTPPPPKWYQLRCFLLTSLLKAPMTTATYFLPVQEVCCGVWLKRCSASQIFGDTVASRCPVVTNGRITVFTCSVCCSRCSELYLAPSLSVITKPAEPAAALDTWNY